MKKMSRKFSTKTLALSVFTLASTLLISTAHANGNVSLGAGIAVGKLPYKSYDTKFWPAPVISYENDYFYVRGISAGVFLLKNDHHRLTVNAYYSPLHFKPSDSDDKALNQLNRRRSTMMAGLGYQYTDTWGIIRAELAGDVLGKSDGIIADLAYFYPIHIDKFRITPGIGVQWQSRQFNDYYFGVSSTESTRSGLSKYSADSGVSTYLSLNANYSLTSSWTLYATGRVSFLSSEAKDSPMVDKSYDAVFSTGITYTF